ncbi:MAG TPA: GntR family transcriptional regulator [Arenibaculum sp.]|nr:GntR family transcriptional regulator [Arenibaculum sp.]
MKPLGTQPILIDQVYERLVEAIADGSLEPGERIRQEEVAAMLGVSRQPVSHALQLLKRQGLLEETGRRGLTVAGIDAGRIRNLYQVRTALDALAARLAAERVAAGAVPAAQRDALHRILDRGSALGANDPVSAYVRADVEFHTAIYRLSGNTAIEETVSAQWLHLQRSMGMVLVDPGQRPLVWEEHAVIVRLVAAGDPAGAEAAARAHTDRAANETAQRLAETTVAA